MNNMPVEVFGVTVFAPYQGYVLILKERKSDRWLPIFIGHYEAQTISMLQQEVKFNRPLTYDLFHNLLDSADATIEKVVVTELKDGTFFSEVSLRTSGGTIRKVDARPSDAVALAIKTGAPVYVSDLVLNEAGVTGEISMTPKPDVKEQLQELNVELQQAVASEAYEEAANIRDKIKELEQNF